MDSLTTVQGHALYLAQEEWEKCDGQLSQTCDAPISRGPLAGKMCPKPAGQGTAHVGFGRCIAHRGVHRKEMAYGGWLMAHAYAQARDTTPWDALLEELRDLTGQVLWLNEKIGTAQDDDDIRPGGTHWDWVVMRDERGKRRAQVAQVAIACGVAERLVQHVELQADLVYKAAQLTARDLGLDDDATLKLLQTLARNVSEVEKHHNTLAIEGEMIESVHG